MPQRDKYVPMTNRKQKIKYIVGFVMLGFTLLCWAVYFKDPEGIKWLGTAGAIFLIPTFVELIWAWKSRPKELHFKKAKPQITALKSSTKSKANGEANALIICARKSGDYDRPVAMKFVHLNHIPSGARQHYFRNFGKHLYEIYNDTNIKANVLDKYASWKPVRIADRRPFSPRTYNIFSTMQSFKEAMEYVPMSTLEKYSPLALLAAIFIIGILMVMTVTE